VASQAPHNMSNATVPGSSLQHIPNVLRQFDRWLHWQAEIKPDGTVGKRPRSWCDTFWSSYYDSAQWRSFEHAAKTVVNESGGVGFALTEPLIVEGVGRLLALDLDACRNEDTGKVEPWALAVIAKCGMSYTEVTPSQKGLRCWVIVRNCPPIYSPDFVPREPTRAPGTEPKAVECQVFGGESEGYVTVTGRWCKGSSQQVEVIDNLDWWSDLFTRAADSIDGSGRKALAELPKGVGPEPTRHEIEAFIRGVEDGEALWRCEWRDLKRFKDKEGKGKKAPSNSDAWLELEKLVYRACRGHGEAAIKFLLHECPRWSGPGVDPKYSRRDWVVADFKRAAAYVSIAKFEPLPDEGQSNSSPNLTGTAGAGAVAAARRFRVRGWEDVLTDPPVRWLIDDVLPRNGLVILGGAPGAAKTLLVLDAGLHMAHGLEWMGKKTKPGSMLYLAGEGGGGLGARLRAWRSEHADAVRSAGEFVAVVDGVPNLAAESAVATLLAMLEQVAADYGKLPEVVVIDTLAMAAPGADENDAAAIGMVLRVLAEVRLRTGCTFIVLHHLRKMTPGQGGLVATMDALRGSSAVAGAADVVLLAMKEGGGKRVLRVAKSRDGEEGGPVSYRVCGRPTGSLREDGGVELAPVVRREIVAQIEPQAAAEGDRERDDESRILSALIEMGGSRSIDAVVRKAGLKMVTGRDAFHRLAGRREILETRSRGKSNYTGVPGGGGCVPPRPPVPRDVGTSGTSALGLGARPGRPGRRGTSRDVQAERDFE
jgi:hypothetical protein